MGEAWDRVRELSDTPVELQREAVEEAIAAGPTLMIARCIAELGRRSGSDESWTLLARSIQEVLEEQVAGFAYGQRDHFWESLAYPPFQAPDTDEES